ncbi:transposase [Micromonospora sp. DT178]|uniref:transposase n=1 Tax=Micromonospora sp. DT178 TaxID=3393436 RepID=UPI003CF71B6A
MGGVGAVAAQAAPVRTSAGVDRRQSIDGIRWRTRVGSPWRDVPALYGPWQPVYGLFRRWRWQRAGVWRDVVTALQARADTAGLITWDVSVDSTSVRASRVIGSGRRRRPPGADRPVRRAPADRTPRRGRVHSRQSFEHMF